MVKSRWPTATDFLPLFYILGFTYASHELIVFLSFYTPVNVI